MLRTLLPIGFGLIMMVHCVGLYAVESTAVDQEKSAAWMTGAFDSDIAALPFSFVYDGQPSDTLLNTWKLERTEKISTPGERHRSLRFTDPETGLVLVCDIVRYEDVSAVEWVLYFENRGDRDTPILSDIRAADFPVTATPTDTWTLRHADGSQGVATDFHPRETLIPPKTSLIFSPEGGRSSDGVMPYFNLFRAQQGGMMVGVGWTGQWAASFVRDEDSEIRIQAGMARTHLRLHPGERIRTPSTLLIFYSGDSMEGHNLLRKYLRLHAAPRPGGNPLSPPIAASAAAIPFNAMTETNQIAAIGNIAQKGLPVDTWWMDAGWSTGGFPEGMGTWEPDPKRFPKGLESVGEAAHKAGLKFLLWFEPERVMPGTWLRENHPEWLLAPVDLPAPVAYQKDWRLLNLGNPEALAWAKRTFSGMVGDYGVDIYRHDCNIHPLYYWQNGEADDRQGMNEIRYITGLYDFFDTLAREHPGLLLDNCASGGRRLDFEMMRRSTPLWRTDYCWDPVGAQNISYGLSYWLPFHGLGAVSLDPYHFRSGYGTNVSLVQNYYSAEAPFWPTLTKLIHEYSDLRPLFFGDFYPLTAYAVTKDVWLAWQYDRPDLGRGLVQAFRRGECPAESVRLTFHGLDPNAVYEVRDLDQGEAIRMKGRELMKRGLDVTRANSPAAVVVVYRRVRVE